MIPAQIDGLRPPVRFIARARIDRRPDGSLQATGLPSSSTPAPQGYTAMMCDPMANHYFHFMELTIWLWALQHRFLNGVPPARIVFAHNWDNAAQNHVQRGVLGALYPGVPILDAASSWPAAFDNVLIYDRFAGQTLLNKVLEPAMGFARPFVVAMARQIRGAAGAHGARHDIPRLLHVARPPKRCFAPAVRAALLQAVQSRGVLKEADFAVLPWAQQVRLAAAHDVLLGVHGNGLTNLLWMRPSSLVLEFFPAGVHHYDYQFLAELCGVDYFAFEAHNVFPAFCRFGEPYGHNEATLVPVTSAPLPQVLRILDAWAEQRK